MESRHHKRPTFPFTERSVSTVDFLIITVLRMRSIHFVVLNILGYVNCTRDSHSAK